MFIALQLFFLRMQIHIITPIIPQDVYGEVFGKMRFCELFSHGHASRARCIKFTCGCGGRKAKVRRDIQTTHTEED